MKNFVIHIAAIILALTGPVAAQRFEGSFCEPLLGTQGFSQALAEVSPPEVTGCGQAEEKEALNQPVNFLIRSDFRAADSMTAFDPNSGDKITLYRFRGGWTARISIAGAAERGTITALRGNEFTYLSGNTSLTLERAAVRYRISGRLHGGPAGTGSREISLVSGPRVGAGFTLDILTEKMNFSRRSVSSRSADPKLAGIMTALYMALIRDEESGLFRAVDFEGRASLDEYGHGWTSCSQTGENWRDTDIEYIETGHLNHKVRVCEVEVTWNCGWKKCEELYPNTEPGQCYCKASCSKSSHNTGRCEWVDAE